MIMVLGLLFVALNGFFWLFRSEKDLEKHEIKEIKKRKRDLPLVKRIFKRYTK